MKNKCKCGCGMRIKSGNRFIRGHNRKGKKLTREHLRKISDAKLTNGTRKIKPRPILCGCGCGGLAKSGCCYINGHQNIGRILVPKPDPILCKCGCGKLAGSGKSYVHGLTWKNGSSPTKGVKLTEEHKRKISSSQPGEKHWNWKGGIVSKEWHKYHPYMTWGQYWDLLERIKKRDLNTCVYCGKKCGDCKTDMGSITHHVIPIKIGYKSHLCDHESNMVVVHSSCHRGKIHGNQHTPDRWKEFLPLAKKYLLQFDYAELLLDRYARSIVC